MTGMNLPGINSLTVIAFCFGLIFGSFYNVCIYRLPLGKSLVKPRSFCPGCGKTIPWYENIPVFSWIVLKARCSDCGMPIPFRYTLVELISGFLFAFGVHRYGISIQAMEFIVLASLMLILFFTDLEERILPDRITLWFLPVGLLFAWLSWERTVLESALVGLAGAGGLFLLAWVYFKIKGIEGMGLGDVKMLALMGTFLGIKAFLALLIASLLGSVIGVVLVSILKKGRRYEIPFGSFLAVGTIVAYIYGNDMLRWYVTRYIVH